MGDQCYLQYGQVFHSNEIWIRLLKPDMLFTLPKSWYGIKFTFYTWNISINTHYQGIIRTFWMALIKLASGKHGFNIGQQRQLNIIEINANCKEATYTTNWNNYNHNVLISRSEAITLMLLYEWNLEAIQQLISDSHFLWSLAHLCQSKGTLYDTNVHV